MAQIELFKDSDLGLKGKTPERREASLRTSQLHAQENGNTFVINAKASSLDLDGKKPNTYRDTAPEGASF